MAQPGLEPRARELDAFVREHLTDPNGLILSWIDARTLRPFGQDTFVAGDRMRHPAAAGVEDFGRYFAYENSGMCTGAWLAAQVERHHVTGEAAALELARAAASALLELYRRSQAVEEGFFSKFHAGKLSNEISTDQCLYAMVGADRYCPLACPSEKKQIAAMIAGMAGFWRRRKYRHPYRERDYDWEWPLNRFPVMMWLAWKHTGDPEYREEFLRLSALDAVRNRAPFLSRNLAEFRREKAENPASLWPFSVEHAAQGQLSLQPLIDDGAPERGLWLSQLREMMEACLPGIDGDLLQRGHFSYEESTGEAMDIPSGYHASGSPNPVWEAKYFHSPARSGLGPAMFARALLMASRSFPGLPWRGLALRILEATDLGRMRFKIDPGGHLPDNQQWLTHCLCGDAVVNWLWAYWLARRA